MLVMVDTDMDDVVTAVVAEGHLINQRPSWTRTKRPDLAQYMHQVFSYASTLCASQGFLLRSSGTAFV